jgi:hypothetical protein
MPLLGAADFVEKPGRFQEYVDAVHYIKGLIHARLQA